MTERTSLTRFTESPKYEDAFENVVAERTNVLDIAAHYPYSPERWRLFVGGSRKFPEYNSVSQYNHATDRHELKPASGETVVFESAEKPRYVVQYELAATFAFSVNQSLDTGDKIKIGLYDGSDGWYLEHNGSHPDDTTGDAVMERGGSEVYRESDVDLQQAVTKFARFKLETGWYDLTRQRWERSYPTADGEQKNQLITKVGSPDSQGPQTGNLPVHFEVQASASTSSLILEAGSAAQVNLGRTTSLTRNKQTLQEQTIDSKNTFVPLLAGRIDPDRDIIDMQLNGFRAIETAFQDDAELVAIACHPSKVLDTNDNELDSTDFSTPATTQSQSSAFEITTNVAKFPDSTGSVTTSATDPGGFQVGHGDISTAQGNATASNSSEIGEPKRPLYGRDVLVVLGKSGSTGDITYEITVEEDW